jgi:hypothetical protein
MTKDSD